MENNIMVEVYVQLIKAGRKSVDQVPLYGGLRNAVAERLNAVTATNEL
ncbi:CD1375 family protein [Paenibacillus barengoltzii]